jgi:uncharacterized protein
VVFIDILGWIVVSLVFIVAYVGLIYPIIPSVLFIIAGYLLYGLFFSFEQFSILFWVIQAMFVILLFVADYFSNLVGVKRYGGSKAGIWGSTIGLLVGPFVIPVVGIVVGPFLGAVIAELLVHRKSIGDAMKVGYGSLIGFLSSIVVKGALQTIMIVYFIFQVQ